MQQVNDTIRTFPRTLAEAFPYAPDGPICAHDDGPYAHETWDVVIYAIGSFGLGLIVGMAVSGVGPY